MSQNRILFTGGQVFDGTGAPPVPADVVVRGDRIESVRAGGGTPVEVGDQVVDCAGWARTRCASSSPSRRPSGSTA
jgi:N-acyl-D-aspartate/D-glutamate deacylase